MFGRLSVGQVGRGSQSGRRLRISFPGALSLVLGAALAAQNPVPAPAAGGAAEAPKAEVPAVAKPDAATAVPATAPAPLPAVETYGKVVVDGARPRCWPSSVAMPPQFEDVLAKDQVVGVGRAEAGFRAIVLPLGPIGYVNKKFTATDADGLVSTKGNKVAFRYRPKTTEAPVSQLPDATRLTVIGEQDDWWKVRAVGVEAWLPEVELQVLAGSDPTVTAAFQALQTTHAADAAVRLQKIAAENQQKERDRLDQAALAGLAETFARELEKPKTTQDYAPLLAALDSFEKGLAEGSGVRGSVQELRDRIKAQQWIRAATEVAEAKVVPAVAPPAQPRDELDRLNSIGWLRRERLTFGKDRFYLERGGIKLHMVECTSGRYDLLLFEGREVGLAGPRRRPATETLTVLDVERLEVLSAGPK